MPSVEEFTDPYLAAYTPPPPAGEGVCEVCHGAPFAGHARCWSCEQTTGNVSHPLELVVPISLYKLSGQLHSVLYGYKRSSVRAVRRKHRLQVAATLHRFVREHGDHVREAAGADWDTVTIVPSKSPERQPHALERVVKLGRVLSAQYWPLLEPWQPDEIGRARSSDLGYRTTADVDGLSVLLVDDTFTSGATFQSAASVLAREGAQVVAGIVIGRVIHPEFSAEAAALWERQEKLRFDFGVCCLER